VVGQAKILISDLVCCLGFAGSAADFSCSLPSEAFLAMKRTRWFS